MSESFGQRLRNERERLEIPLSTIAENTKISITLLEGLERDDLSRWPAGIFRRSFLRLYAEALGLDAEALLREFLTLFPDPQALFPDFPVPQQRETGSVDAPQPIGHSPMRLTLGETTWSPFAGGLRLVPARRRLMAAAWDLTVLIGIAASVFAVSDRFWLPLGLSSLLYYVGGILMLGNTPGVCLFAPISKQADVVILAEPSEQRSDREPTRAYS